MSTSVAVRDATVQDAEAIAAIYAHYIDSSLATLAKDIASGPDMLKRINHVHAKDLPFLVVTAPAPTDGERICGYAYADDWSELLGFETAAEDTIYIHPDYRGGGMGKVLLEALLEKLLSCEKKTQLLAKMSISPERKPEALATCRLHARLGFKVVGRVEKVGLTLGQWVDVIIYQLNLGKLRAKGSRVVEEGSVDDRAHS